MYDKFNMSTVSIPKNEYLKLRKQAGAYRKLVGKMFETVLRDPVEDFVEDFRKTDLYTEDFLRDLGDGLRKSSYYKK